ncbi:hypothetical protein SETIT_7G081000v2 [Setaria italica]|uniref:Uncharacterized protein n=1 Tax=Setaria italica TaxID=4555 RepID=A0A368RV17_SETIT|nr:hypothetical protein SETIT_7G081000v2 [Setaria italica]
MPPQGAPPPRYWPPSSSSPPPWPPRARGERMVGRTPRAPGAPWTAWWSAPSGRWSAPRRSAPPRHAAWWPSSGSCVRRRVTALMVNRRNGAASPKSRSGARSMYA